MNVKTYKGESIMTLYSVNLFKGEKAQPISLRAIPCHRAKRIVAWLRREGFDAYIAPVRVTA